MSVKEFKNDKWVKWGDPNDCNAAVIPKQKILDSIYRTYRDRWIPLSNGEDAHTPCDLCALVREYNNDKRICSKCVIRIDSVHCEGGGLFQEYMVAANHYGVRSKHSKDIAIKICGYLLALHVRVYRDEVKLPYLAVQEFASKHMNKPLSVKEITDCWWNPPAFKRTEAPPKPKKVWRRVDTSRVSAKAHKGSGGDYFCIDILVDGEKRFRLSIKDAVPINNQKDFKLIGHGGHRRLANINEYIEYV